MFTMFLLILSSCSNLMLNRALEKKGVYDEKITVKELNRYDK